MHTQTKKLVGAIGATAAFTAALTGGITAVHQYSENAASADTVTGSTTSRTGSLRQRRQLLTTPTTARSTPEPSTNCRIHLSRVNLLMSVAHRLVSSAPRERSTPFPLMMASQRTTAVGH